MKKDHYGWFLLIFLSLKGPFFRPHIFAGNTFVSFSRSRPKIGKKLKFEKTII